MLYESIKTGFKKGIETTWMLAKIIIPVYIFVTLLKYTPVIDWISYLFQPLMGLFNLPGEAVIVLVLGNVLDPYAAIGAIKAMDLTSSEITTLAIMICFSHSLFIETAIVKKLGLSLIMITSIRVGLALIFGVVVGQVGGLLW